MNKHIAVIAELACTPVEVEYHAAIGSVEDQILASIGSKCGLRHFSKWKSIAYAKLIHTIYSISCE